MPTARALIGLVLIVPAAAAQEPWKRPPDEITALVDERPAPQLSTSPAGDRVIIIERDAAPSIADLATPFVPLAGARVDPAANGPHDTMPRIHRFIVRSLAGGDDVEIRPEGRASSPVWSHDGQRFLFTVATEGGTRLHVHDIASGRTRRILGRPLNAAGGAAARFMPDGRRILVRLVPAGRGAAPVAPRVPPGPLVHETAGRKSRVWTYQDLLRTPHDDALFVHYFTSELALVDPDTGAVTAIGRPGIFLAAAPSPDGSFLLTERAEPPWSHAVPFQSFGRAIEILDAAGAVVRTIDRRPAAEEVPVDGVPEGPRQPEWHPLAGATLVWAEALDGGDPEREAPHRDRILALAAPFAAEPREVLKLEQRFQSLEFTEEGLGIVTESQRKKRWRWTRTFDFEKGPETLKLLFSLSTQDAYKDPGRPVMRRLPGGAAVRSTGGTILLEGSGATPEGERPFLDRFDLATGQATRIFQSAPDAFESVAAVLPGDGSRFITRRESRVEPPNHHLVDGAAATRRPLTDYRPDPGRLAAARSELIRYAREDGVELSGTLYVPADRRDGERLPLVVWAYPLEYNDRSTAAQVRGSPNRFTLPRGASHLFFLLRGYAVLDSAAMPVVGDYRTVNDTYVSQIVMNARAAVKAVADRGIADPDRAGVGGHSYGAFMTANLLAHCDVFRAGIARSGAYNRTLTPFGFQSERRTFWEATDTYVLLSPFTHVPKINEPVLLIHGEKDSNTGTFPIQSERLFHALRGHGGIVRYVVLPHEDHGYSARESILHVLAEMIDWFDRHVKNVPARPAAPESAPAPR